MTAPALSAVEIVLVEGVLRPVAAARHALTALGAGLARGTGAAEVGVGHLSSGLRARGPVGVLAVTEEDAHRGQMEGVTDAHRLGDGLEVDVRRGHGRVEPHPEHPLRLVVVGRQFGLPVGDAGPLTVLEEGRRWHVQGVGVVEGAAAHSGAGQHHHLAEQVHPLDAEQSERGGPQVVLDVPGVLGQGRGGEAAARLEDADPVPLLAQPQGRDRAAEARADDEDVVVVRVVVRGRNGPAGLVLGMAVLGHGSPRYEKGGWGRWGVRLSAAGRPSSP